ncbi:MAG: GNAT family N-acetyltransferase [Deinococcota bacterium]
MTTAIRISTTDRPSPEHVQRLFKQTDWADTRSLEGIAIMLEHSSLCISMWDGESLIGFARALSDGVYRAYLDDVVIDEAYRGRGLGRQLLEAVSDHLQDIEQISLLCAESRIPFYTKFGFELSDITYMQRRYD